MKGQLQHAAVQTPLADTFLVGDMLVQPSLNTISSTEMTSQVEPKIMEVLVYLASHCGNVVPKERLIAAVWEGSFVTDDVLTRGISELRKAFGDSWKQPRFIQTIPKRGYRLIAPVAPAAGSPTRRASGGLSPLAGGLLMLVRLWKAWLGGWPLPGLGASEHK